MRSFKKQIKVWSEAWKVWKLRRLEIKIIRQDSLTTALECLRKKENRGYIYQLWEDNLRKSVKLEKKRNKLLSSWH